MSRIKVNTEGLPTPPPSSTEHEEIYIEHVCDPYRRHGRYFTDRKDSTSSTCSSGSEVYTSPSSSWESFDSMRVEVSRAPLVIMREHQQRRNNVPPPPLTRRPILQKAYRNPPPRTPNSSSGSNGSNSIDNGKAPLSVKSKYTSHKTVTQSASSFAPTASVGSSSSHSRQILPLFVSHLKNPWAGLSMARSRWSPDSSDDEEQRPRGRDRRRNGAMLRLSGAANGLARRLSSASSHARSGRDVRSSGSSAMSHGSSHSQRPSRQHHGARRSG
ncbi:hypothetical protein PG991_013926 [Apiospora marii]|uniref:Uncharacterized protein n=1 Tax=Apiospora marii TaxID=335849 RepID=A0ABR1R7E2_9PEZI